MQSFNELSCLSALRADDRFLVCQSVDTFEMLFLFSSWAQAKNLFS